MPVQTDNLGAIPYEGCNLLRGPHSHDSTAEYGHCLRYLVLGVHGDDVTPCDYQIGTQSNHFLPPYHRSRIVIAKAKKNQPKIRSRFSLKCLGSL